MPVQEQEVEAPVNSHPIHWRARPTIYRGVQMRSRLEARFAAGLDKLGVEWDYEPCCFADQSGQYLPDFAIWALGDRCFIEVKPTAEAALAARDRMMVIRSSEPYAALAVATPEWGPWVGVDSWGLPRFDAPPGMLRAPWHLGWWHADYGITDTQEHVPFELFDWSWR